MKEEVRITIASSTIVKALMWVAIFAGILYVSDFMIALLVAVVLASAAELPVKYMVRVGIPRALSVGILFLSLIGIIVAVALIFIPPLADDVARFIQTLPKILDSIRIFGRDMGFKDLSVAVQDLSKDISKGQILSILKTTFFGSSGLFATTSAVLHGVVNLVLTFVLAFSLPL